MAQVGRPRKEVDWDQVSKMASIMCTQVEICDIIGMCEDTINTRCKEEHGINFSEYLREKGAYGKRSLRRKQYEKAMSGNTTMQIWLGKQWLGQKERNDSPTHEIRDGELIINLGAAKAKDDD
jgi:hypothetical protein